MDRLLLLLLLLGVFPLVFFQGVAPATLCKVCSIFKKGKCLEGEGNCTMEAGPGCRTTDVYFFHVRDMWHYNHTQLDCSDKCRAWKLIRAYSKVSSFCCEGQEFCNMYRGRSLHWKRH
nr:prostate and testis expressed protein 3 isoform X2 [Vicugna pacos]XP_031526229.1 prostate and testis expressed protein 3 isoform X2 [Vicugna pacos]